MIKLGVLEVQGLFGSGYDIDGIYIAVAYLKLEVYIPL